MSDQNINYHDDNFDLYQAYSYTLLLQLEATSFSYAIVYKHRLLVLAQDNDLQKLADPRQLSELLSATYKKVIVGLPATGLTLVPNSLFREDQIANFARLLDVKDDDKVFAQTLDDQNMIVFKTPGALVSAAEAFNLQNAVYTGRGWIKAIEKTSPPGDNLYLEIDKETVQFLYFSSGNLRFYNIFEFKNEDELAYFTSFVAEELNLKPQQTTLVLSGDVDTDDKNMSRLADFFATVELNNLGVIDLPGQIATHKMLALAALTLCASSEVF
jgi:hypothetical protein